MLSISKGERLDILMFGPDKSVSLRESPNLSRFDLFIQGTVEPGHHHASGSGKYPGGTVTAQTKPFQEAGLDISHCYPGTINLSIAPRKFTIIKPRFHLQQIEWWPGRRPENFLICDCQIQCPTTNALISGFVYYPDPVTKTGSVDKPTQIQLLAPKIPDIHYNSQLTIILDSRQISIEAAERIVINEAESLQKAIHEQVSIVPYDPNWVTKFEAEKRRLRHLFSNELVEIEHIGSTAVPGMAAKPIVDLIASVKSMDVADRLLTKLCENGYTTSAEFNATLKNRRWLMRYENGSRTHHLHLVLTDSVDWNDKVKFRDILRKDPVTAAAYVSLKQELARSIGKDREQYTDAKKGFVEEALLKAIAS